jgi:glycosyltransferase involved in cell wall biosynthesis
MKEEMNILLLSAGKGWGGIESQVVTLASALLKKGHKIIIGCPDEGQVQHNAKKLGLPTTTINVVNSGDLFAVSRIVKTVKRENIKIIIANLGKEYWPAAMAAKISGVKLIFVRHQLDKLKKSTAWLISQHVDKVVAVSQCVKDSLVNNEIPSEKIAAIYNGIEMDKFNAAVADKNKVRAELNIDKDAIVIGHAGKLDKGKGVFDLLRAMENVCEKYLTARLLFVGEGPAQKELEILSGKLGLKNKVTFVGVQRDIFKMYSVMDIFVLASTTREAFGMALVEAMAMEIPVIGTTIGGIPEIIQNGINGILVNANDSQSLAGGIIKYVEDRNFSKKVSLEGRKTVEEKFTNKRMADEFEELFKKLNIC